MAQYIDFAECYDFDHAITLDIAFYRDFAAEYGAPILELACGTGRLVVPLAAAGHEVYGLDISSNMLAICAQHVEERGLASRVHLSLAGMSEFELPRRDFGFAFVALRSFMHLLTHGDQLACLRCVHRHLRPGGCFIVDLIAPGLARLAVPPSDAFVLRREFDLPDGHHVLRKDRLAEHDPVHQVRRFEFRFEEYDEHGGLVRERVVPISTRWSKSSPLSCTTSSVPNTRGPCVKTPPSS